MSDKVKFKEILTSINEAPTGGFIGLTDYVSKDNSVVSVTGRLGCSYGDSKALAIKELKEAINKGEFEAIKVAGKCYFDTAKNEYNSRMRSIGTLTAFDIEYSKDQVLEAAREILEAWETPSERNSNKVELSNKENGMVFNPDTGTFTFALMVDHEYYKAEKTALLNEGIEKGEKAQAPETVLKAEIRDRFQRKIKTYEIGNGKFASITIGGKRFESESIIF